MSAFLNAEAGNRTSLLAETAIPCDPIRIGLINNMPDSALRRTEQQFESLLQEAAGILPVRFVCYSLPDVPRSEASRQRLALSYRSTIELSEEWPDAVVVTGTEPCQTDLRDEIYWGALSSLIDRIDKQNIPAMFSCLAAHAAVLHTDGIGRHPLGRKCFGVFEHDIMPDHSLMVGAGTNVPLPHTRWNEVRETSLLAAGYDILSWSPEVGVGFFSQQRGSLWLFCQGHPEYDGVNLLREYRRDVSRFLSRKQQNYPDLPKGYFARPVTEQLCAFKQQAMTQADPCAMDAFPDVENEVPPWNAWRQSAVQVFGNWLKSVATSKARKRLPSPVIG